MKEKHLLAVKMILSSAALLAPALMNAQTSAPTTFSGFILLAIDLIKTTIPIIVGFGILAFFWGLVKFIGKAGDVKSHDDGKNLMIWGIIGLFVIVAIWGILQFLTAQFGFDDGGTHMTALPQ